MRDITTNRHMKTILLDKGEKIPAKRLDLEFFLHECFIKPDGGFTEDGKDQPSVCFFAMHPNTGNRVYFQASSHTLQDMIKALEKL